MYDLYQTVGPTHDDVQLTVSSNIETGKQVTFASPLIDQASFVFSVDSLQR